MNLKEYWNNLHKGGYDGFTHPSEMKRVEGVLLKRVPLNKNMRALEFGCGNGNNITWLSKHVGSMVGTDISGNVIEKARARFKDNAFVSFKECGLGDLSMFESESFDLIFSYLVMQHVEKKYMRLYFKEFRRILKPNGYLFFQAMGEPFLNLFPVFIFRHGKQGEYLTGWTRGEVGVGVVNAGLRLEGIEEIVPNKTIPTLKWFFVTARRKEV